MTNYKTILINITKITNIYIYTNVIYSNNFRIKKSFLYKKTRKIQIKFYLYFK